jgi:hypothetical protein
VLTAEDSEAAMQLLKSDARGVVSAGRRILLATCAAIAMGFPRLDAQAPAQPDPMFMIFRYASRSALSMYSGYRAGPVIGLFGMLQNPRTPYREIMAGIGTTIGPRGRGVTVAPAVAWSNTGWYAELYLVPVVRSQAVSVSGIVFAREPLKTGGTRALFISPAALLCYLGGGFSAGATYYGTVVQGVAATHAMGPALQHAIPHGWVRLELVKGLVASAPDELRFAVQAGF